MARWFNTAGPCNPEHHYMLPPLRRLPEVPKLVDQGAYFVVHAPRQIGKTTTLMSFAAELTAGGRYAAVLFSMEVGAAFQDDVGAAELAVLTTWRHNANHVLPADLRPPPWPDAPAGSRIAAALEAWSASCPRPVVVFLDEIDALREAALISVLRQLRGSYPNRPRSFPWSLALIGLRDVREYKVSSGGSDRLGTSSPFNIKVESLTLRDFTATEVSELYGQHTRDTGQEILPEAVDRAFHLTRGQPWLVNALARQLVEVVAPNAARSINAADVGRAKDILIDRQDTHLDSLVDRLRDPRIRTIIEPMLAGSALGDIPPDDIRFAIDLGLVRVGETGGIEVANPIYREIVVRELAFTPRASLPSIQPTWLRRDGRLDPERLLDAFVSFWRQHGEALLGSAPYHEIAPHLVLMAFLHRVVNGGGTIEREYAIGRGRMDLCLTYGPERLAIELKVWRDKKPDPLREGLEQIDEYLAGLQLNEGWLVIFDRRADQAPISERTGVERCMTAGGRSIAVIRA